MNDESAAAFNSALCTLRSSLLFECSRHGARFENECDVRDFAALTLSQKVEENRGGRAVAVPEVARAHALAELEPGGLRGRGAVEDLHFVFGCEVFRVHLAYLCSFGSGSRPSRK